MRENGPNHIALECEATIARLEVERVTAQGAERKAINQRLHMLRDLRKWCMAREGYIPRPRAWADSGR